MNRLHVSSYKVRPVLTTVVAVVVAAAATLFGMSDLPEEEIHSPGMSPRVQHVDETSVLQAAATRRYADSYGTHIPESMDSIIRQHSDLRRNPALLVLDHGIADPAKQGLPQAQWQPRAQMSDAVKLEIQSLNGTKAVSVVQFTMVPGAAQRARLQEAGATIVGYWPNNAYLVSADNAALTAISRWDDVRFTAHVPADLRISPAMQQRIKSHPTMNMIPVKISLFKHMEAARLESLLHMVDTDVQVYHLSDAEIGGSGVIALRADRFEAAVAALSRVEAVARLEFFPMPTPHNSASVWLLQSGTADLQTTPLFDAGITGIGQVYAAADSGLDTDACQFRYGPEAEAQTFENDAIPPAVSVTNPDNKVIAYYTFPRSQAYDEQSGYFHGTMTTGCSVGDNYDHLATRDDPGLDREDGMAPGAKVVFQDVSNWLGEMWGLYTISQVNMHKQAIGSGAAVHNDSYGLDSDYGSFNNYDDDSRQIDYAMWANNDYLVVFASGNSGPDAGTLGGEGSTAKSTVVVGASFPGWSTLSRGDDMVSFSSRGPTDDGRLKPDVVAPGIVRSAVESECEPLEGLEDRYGQPACISLTDPGNDNCDIAFTGGTSFSSPLVAGMALLVRQYFTDGFYPSGKAVEEDAVIPTGALVKAVLLNSARQMTGDVIVIGYGQSERLFPIDARPSTMQGWGRVALDDTLYLKGDRRDLKVLADIGNDSADGLKTGESHQYTISVVSSDYPLKISLAYSDAPGSPGSGASLVNNIDLKVTSANGDVYMGNLGMRQGWSAPVNDGTAFDAINPMENVYIQNPAVGDWRIEVFGASIPGIEEQLNPGPDPRQGYALIATGDLNDDGRLLSDVVFKDAWLTDGCDDDRFLDVSETATLYVGIGNRAGGTSEAVTVRVAVTENSTVPASLLEFPDGTEFAIGSVLGKTGTRVAIPITLKNIAGEGICGEILKLELVITEGDAELYRGPFEIGLHQDEAYHGSDNVRCERDICHPLPVINDLQPNTLAAGESIVQVSVNGAHLPEFATFRFGHPGITYQSLRRWNEELVVLNDVQVDAAVQPGNYAVMVLDAEQNGGEWAVFPDAFTVTEAMVDGDSDMVDGDASQDTVEDAESTDTTDTTPVDPPILEREGCSGGISIMWALAALLGLAIRRRKQ